MGNCLCRAPPPATWSDDDDEAARWAKPEEGRRRKDSSPSSTEVRIRIAKKQLEELLRSAEAEGSTAGEVMKDLINMSMEDDCSEIFHRRFYQWRPSLQSIKEEPGY